MCVMQPGKPYTGSSAQTNHLPGTTDMNILEVILAIYKCLSSEYDGLK